MPLALIIILGIPITLLSAAIFGITKIPGISLIQKAAHILLAVFMCFVILEFLAFPFPKSVLLRERHFRRVEILEVDGPYPGGRVFLQVRSSPGSTPESTTVPTSDQNSLKPGIQTWLMTSDWNIKGPEEQRLTLWRLISAYHVYIAAMFPIWLFIIAIQFFKKFRKA